jgi:hypothetical protein
MAEATAAAAAQRGAMYKNEIILLTLLRLFLIESEREQARIFHSCFFIIALSPHGLFYAMIHT